MGENSARCRTSLLPCTRMRPRRKLTYKVNAAAVNKSLSTHDGIFFSSSFFFSYCAPQPGGDVVVSLDPSSSNTGSSSSWGVGSITWPRSVCHVQHLAFIVTLHEFLVGDQNSIALFSSLLLLSPSPSSHTHAHTQKVQYQMATSVEHETMSMSRVGRGTE